MQPGISVSSRQWLLHVVAEALDLAAGQERDLVSTSVAWQGARFQLAQCDRVLVRGASLHSRSIGNGHLLSLGK
jgi:hypothetical protein